MQQNFQTAFGRTLRHEGGFSDDPRDPGGATNRGITQGVYDETRNEAGLPRRSVRQITDAEVEAIYREQYWRKAGCDQLPAGLDYAVYDYAVNSGVSKAVKDLQRAAGMKGQQVDGIMGLKTLAAVGDRDPKALIKALCDRRLAFLKGLKHWPTYKNGWTKRVAEVRAGALAMAGDSPMPEAEKFAPKAKAARAGVADRKETTWLQKLAKDPLGAAPVIMGSLASTQDMPVPIQWAVAFVIVGGAVWWAVRALKRDPVAE